MPERIIKILLLAAIAIFFTLVILNNMTDYETNFAFVQHVLSMDTIFPESNLKWRAITTPALHHLFYWIIIIWEISTAALCWIGVIQLKKEIGSSTSEFNSAKIYGLIGLTTSCLLWLVVFWSIGGEWFAMWQSPTWNGQPIAFRMFMISSLVLFFIRQPD